MRNSGFVKFIGAPILTLGLALALLACGSSTTSNPDMAVVTPPDMTALPDLTTSPDLAKAVAMGDMAGMPMACAAPSDCKGGAPCCLKLQAQMVTGLSCGSGPTDCAPMIDFSGNGQTRVCTQDTDCTNGLKMSTLPNCCTAKQGGQSIKMCFSQALVAFTMGAVTCP